MNKTLLKFIIFTLIIFTFLIPTANATVLIDSFEHPENVCTVGCHERFSAFSEDGDQVCGNCHDYIRNIPGMETQHNPKICKACHSISNKQTFHTIHKDVGCDTKCHTLEGTNVQVPQVTLTKCDSCHTMKIHTLHGNKISEICSTCHAGAASSKMSPSSSSSPLSSSALSIDLKADYQKFTIYEMLKSLLSELEGT